jgi:hypothetical protein
LLRTKIYTENCSIYYTSAQEKMKGFFPAWLETALKVLVRVKKPPSSFLRGLNLAGC